MKRKIVSLILTSTVALGLLGCGTTETPSPNSSEKMEESIAEEGNADKATVVIEEESIVEAVKLGDELEKVIADNYELFNVGASNGGVYSVDSRFSEGLAWTGYYDECGNRNVGLINEEGKLVFGEEEKKLYSYLGSGYLRNTLFEDGVSALYTNNSFIIFDKKGKILCSATKTNNTEYHLMGYGDGMFPVIKRVTDITGKSTAYLYGIDKSGKVISSPSVWQDGFMDIQHVSYLENGVFTDGVIMFDLNNHKNYYFPGYFASDGRYGATYLKAWVDAVAKLDALDVPKKGSIMKVINDYPMARVYAYYGDIWGYRIRDKVYGVSLTGPAEGHYRFYDIDGKMLCDIPNTVQGKKIKNLGVYSGGYVPVELSDDEDKYITVLDKNATPIYEPLSESKNNISGWEYTASYMGYTVVQIDQDECSMTIITPKGEFKKIGDDLSEMGDAAYMYTDSGWFIADGYISDFDHETQSKVVANVYVSLDGSKIIKKAILTTGTKSLAQDIKKIETVYDDSSTILEDSLSKSSSGYDNALAKILALMSDKAEDSTPDNIIELYKLYGLYDIQDDNYDSAGGASAIGRTRVQIDGVDTDVLVITCRGSKTLEEFIGDWLKGPNGPWGDNTVEFEGERVFCNVNDMTDKVWMALESYIDKYPELKDSKHLKILINGHSLGAASASMVAAKVDNQIKNGNLFNKNVTKEDVYAYTFGGIEVFEENVNISEGYENIHNIYNRYDAYGPEGNSAIWGASSPNAKFGHTEMFELDLEESASTDYNHWMSTYEAALDMNEIYDGFINHCN